jgi:hypothetical protein
MESIVDYLSSLGGKNRKFSLRILLWIHPTLCNRNTNSATVQAHVRTNVRAEDEKKRT